MVTCPAVANVVVGHKLADIVHRYAHVKALVIGDAIIDQYHFGRVDRISPEAPIPVYVEDYTRCESRRGGADNVAHQLEVLGCEVETIFPRRRSVKHRYLVGHYQVFRRDSDATEECFTDFDFPEDLNVVVLSDYAKGFLSESVCKSAIAAASFRKIPVVVDPKGKEWGKYSGASVLCPNSKELLDAEIFRFDGEIVEKCGADGLRILGKPNILYPAKARNVFDVTGAGDVVTAIIAATLGAGEHLAYACEVANLAAGYVVGEVGTTVCPKEKLLELCASA